MKERRKENESKRIYLTISFGFQENTSASSLFDKSIRGLNFIKTKNIFIAFANGFGEGEGTGVCKAGEG
jgi:hypothetical protein